MVQERNTKLKIIKLLEKKAAEVKDLKTELRQKRPIVIEFSGSPKSGKSTCISSLELFLKRNGFKVKIIQERAGICPVSNKQDPMFNMWTSCMSLAGMLGVVKSKNTDCDFLILDRGIFDALTWFHWLNKRGKLSDKDKVVYDTFFTSQHIINYIDLIFVFTVTPEVSIQREYAGLLTNKTGSIMNKKVLNEYLNSIGNTINSKKEYFHNILQINTSEKEQNDVSKEVTEKILDELYNYLMEKIAYVEVTPTMRKRLSAQKLHKYSDIKDMFSALSFNDRKIVENNEDYIQPIPVALIISKKRNKVFVVKKQSRNTSKDSPEKDKYLAYVGGHIRQEDRTDKIKDDFLKICEVTLYREMNEEIGTSYEINDIEPYIIYTPDSTKSKQHICICYVFEVDEENEKFNIDSFELVQNRGKSKSGTFFSIKNINDNIQSFESWSIEMFCNILDFKIEKPISFFDLEDV